MITRTPILRSLADAVDRHANYAIFALFVVPLIPDLAADLSNGSLIAAALRIAAALALLVLLTTLHRRRHRSTAAAHAAARATMTDLGHYDVLLLPLNPTPIFRPVRREHDAESVPELLVDGHNSLNPSTVVLLRTPQVDEQHYRALVTAMATARPGLRIEHLVLTDAYDPERVATDVRTGLARLTDTGTTPLDEAIRTGRRTAAADLTGATALVTLGLARVAHDLGAHCVYITGDRGPRGTFLIGSQDRHHITTHTLFGTHP